MGQNQSRPASVSGYSVTDDEHSRDNLNDSVVSEHSVGGTPSKGKGKNKQSRKKQKGSEDNTSEFEVVEPTRKGGILHKTLDNTPTTASSSRKSSLNSSCSNENDDFKLQKLDGSPKKYRIPRWKNVNQTKETAKPAKASTLPASSKMMDSFVMVNTHEGTTDDDPGKSFVMVPEAEQLNQFDTNQKIKDVASINSGKQQAQQTNVTPSRRGTSEEKVEITAKDPKVFVSYSKKIAEREQASQKSVHPETSQYEETDLDQAFLMKQKSPIRTNMEPMKTTRNVSREQWFLSGNSRNSDTEKNTRLSGSVSSPTSSVSSPTSPKSPLDLSGMIHINNGQALGQKLQKTVPSMKTDSSWKTTDLDVPSTKDTKTHHEPNGDWSNAKHFNFTPNTVAKSKTASIYGTLPRGQQPRQSLLRPRGGVIATDLDAYEWSKSADALDKVGVYAAEVNNDLANRKLNFDTNKAVDDLSFRDISPYTKYRNRPMYSANKPASKLTTNVTLDESLELHISENEADQPNTQPSKTVLTTEAVRLDFGQTKSAATSMSAKHQLPRGANRDTKPGTKYWEGSRLPSHVVSDSQSMDDPELDIYSAGVTSQTSNLSSGNKPQRAISHAANPYLPRSQPVKRIVNIGEKTEILRHVEREWRGHTANARTMRKGYERIPALVQCSNLRCIRGDNYCAIRAALYQTLLNNNMNITLGEDLTNITEVPDWFMNSGYEWVKTWTFACRLRNIIDPIQTMKTCLNALQEQIEICKNTSNFEEREQKLLDTFNHPNRDLDIQLMEAVKLLMLYNAVRLYEDNTTGKQVPVFVWLLYARDTSETPRKLMWNHLNTVGDSGGLEQIEMFLLGHTLGVTLQVVRPSHVDKEDFLTNYPDDHIADWPRITMIAEDDRHYNIAIK